jgi:DNA-directed RNA polymerase beta subunit
LKPENIILNCDLPEVFGALLPRRFKLTLVEHSQKPFGTRKFLGLIIRIMLLIKKVDCVRVASHFDIWCMPKKIAEVIPNALPIAKFTPRQLPKQSTINRLVYVGRLANPQKNPGICLDIAHPNNINILNYLKASILQSNEYLTQEDCIKYITSSVIYTPINMEKEEGQKKKKEFAIDVLTNDLFPNCKLQIERIYLLGYMTYKLIKCAIGELPCDDRDAYQNKRIETTGVLLNHLFRTYFNKVTKDMQKQIIREINNGSWKSTEDYKNIITLTNIPKIVKASTIENGFKRALSTGDFGIKHLNSNKVGVAQVLNRLTFLASISHLRRINTPLDKTGKLIDPRKLHGTCWGYLCPAETPEGQSVGVVKNLSYLTIIYSFTLILI